MRKFHFVGTCVGLPGPLIHYLKHNGKEISYRQMAKVADLSDWRGMRLSVDPYVSFYKAILPSGLAAVYFVHSGIEHLYVEDTTKFDPEREEQLAVDADY
jgi:hypothetical protein